MRRKIPILALGVALILSLVPLLSLSSQTVVSATESGWKVIERGPNFISRQNLDNFSRFSWESAPQWVQAENGSWVPYIFENHYATDGYYQVQSGLIGARIYDGYAHYFSPDMVELRVGMPNDGETWEVERWENNDWHQLQFDSPSLTPSFNVTRTDNVVTITKLYKKDGTLEIQYIFRDGSLLKHVVIYTADTEGVYRVVQQWKGISGSKVKHSKGKNKITNATIIDSPVFEFRDEDDKMTVLELQNSMYYDENGSKLTEHSLQPVTVTPHAREMKADFVFENWALVQDESLSIDPATATLSDPTEDGQVFVGGAKSPELLSIMISIYEDNTDQYRGYVEWDISSIPDNATITNIVFKYHGSGNYVDCHIHEMLGVQPSTTPTTSPELWNEIGEGDNYADPDGFPEVGANKVVNLNSLAVTDLQNQLSSDWFAIGIQPEAGGVWSKIYSLEYPTANPPPTLYVEYTGEPNPPTSLWCEGSANPARITDSTPEFSAVGVDNQGDQMNYYALQVDDDSNFDSPIWDKAKTSITAFSSGSRCSDITYGGTTLTSGTLYYWRIKFWDINGIDSAWSTETATFALNNLPTVTYLKTEDKTDPSRITTTTPTFSWTYSDADGDNQSNWQIWVGTEEGTNDMWNSGELSGDNNSDVYGDGGSALSRGVPYYVQVRTKDGYDWSSSWATGTFQINRLPTQTYSEQTFYMDPPYTPTLKWWFSDLDGGDTQLGVKIQVDDDEGFGSPLWDYSDTSTTVQTTVYAGETLAQGVTYYARVQVRDSSTEWSGTWSENTFTILPIPSLVVTDITVDAALVDRKAHWAGDDDIKISITVADNEGWTDIENVYIWIRDNSDAVVVDNVALTAYENVDANTLLLWYNYNPSDVMLDSALGGFDVKVQAVSTYFENTKDYTDTLGFKLFTVDDHAITFTPVREIYAEGEIITFEPTVKSIESGLAVDNAYLKLELISELGEILRTISGYTNGSGKLSTYTTLLEADVGFYDVVISTSKGAIDGKKLYEDSFRVAAALLVSIESITPTDDYVSGLLRSRSIVVEDVKVKVFVYDTSGTELLSLTSDTIRVDNIAPQHKNWEIPYGLTLAEGTYSYRVEVWTADLGTLYHVSFAEVKLAVAPSQQAVGEWGCVDTVEIKDGTFDVILYRESVVTNPTTVDKSNFYFREVVDAPQGSTVLVKVEGLPPTTLNVDKYGTITKYFDIPASTTIKVGMEVTIAAAVKVEALSETEVVAAVPRTQMEHAYKVTNLTGTTLRGVELTFPVDDVVSVVDEDGEPIVKFWESKSTTVEIPILEPYGETTLTLTAELAPDIGGIIDRLIKWTPFLGIPIIVYLLGLGVLLWLITRSKAGAISQVIALMLPTILLVAGIWVGWI